MKEDNEIAVLLELFFEKKKVKYEKIKEIFGEFQGYFQEGDIEAFLKELVFLKKEEEELDLYEVACFIRDDIEGFAK